jgi:hypothetical protein
LPKTNVSYREFWTFSKTVVGGWRSVVGSAGQWKSNSSSKEMRPDKEKTQTKSIVGIIEIYPHIAARKICLKTA